MTQDQIVILIFGIFFILGIPGMFIWFKEESRRMEETKAILEKEPEFPFGWYQFTEKTFHVRKRRKYWPSSRGY